MVSISKYLRVPGRESETALRRGLRLVLQLIEIHAVEGDEVDYTRFRSGMQGITSKFSDDTPPQDVLIMVGKVATALKDYGERTTRYRKAQAAEYQRMLAMLTDTITATSHASDRAVGRLHDIEKRVERAAVIEDVRVLRMQLDECLESIREEIRCQEAESAALSQSRISGPDSAPSADPVSPPSPENDAVTGLPGRAAAEDALEETVRRDGRWYAVAVVANRLASINSRFGYAVGDRILCKLSEEMRRGLSADDRVFRWSGPCLVGFLRRPAPEHEVRVELNRITGAQKETLVEIGNREILLPTSTAWAIFPFNEPARVIHEKIDRFVASQAAAY